MRVAYVTTSPIPYVTPILNSLASLVDLHVVYLASADTTYGFRDDWGVPPSFAHSFMKRKHVNRSINVSKVDLLTHVSFGSSTELRSLAAEVVCVTSWGPQTIEPVAWARRNGCAAMVWSESTAWSGLLRDRLSSAVRRWSVARADAFLTNGSQASEYLLRLGAPSDAVVTSRLPSQQAVDGDPDRVPRAGGPHFLFVGRLIHRKRPVEVIEAFGVVRQRLPESTLTVVGDGPLATDVRVAARRVGERVRVVGRREGSELRGMYRENDILVLPAKREVWGLVVNEALAHGLFVIASDEVGAAYDLVTPDTGIVLPADDVGAIAPALVNAALSDFSAGARRARADIVTTCTPERMALDWARAAELARELNPRNGVKAEASRARAKSRCRRTALLSDPGGDG